VLIPMFIRHNGGGMLALSGVMAACIAANAVGEERLIRVPTTTTLVTVAPSLPKPTTTLVTTPITTVIKPPTTTLVTPPTTTTVLPAPTITTPPSTTTTTTPITALTIAPIQTVSQILSTATQGVTVGSTGALVVSTAITTPLIISTSAVSNAAILLPLNQPVSIAAGSTTLTYVDLSGSSQLVVRNTAGSPTVEVGRGRVGIKSTVLGNSIPLVSDGDSKPLATLTTTSTNDSMTIVKSDSQSKVFVESGKVNLTGVGLDSAVPVFQGENAKLDSSGKLLQIALGSLDGTKQLPGDPLPRQKWVGADTVVPKLDGKLARFDNQKSLLDIVQGAFKDIFGIPGGGVLTYDSTTGVFTLTIGNSSTNLIPVGSPVVPYSYHGSSATKTASGAFDYASQGIQIALAGALAYFQDLMDSISALDVAGTVTLKSDGVLEIVIDGVRYATIPGATATVPSNPTLGQPGFSLGQGNLILFRDHLGAMQTLYPSFAYPDKLKTRATASIPGADMVNNGDGTVAIGASGQTFTLVPEYALRTLPASHAAEGYWAESGRIFLNNDDNSCQGFQVR